MNVIQFKLMRIRVTLRDFLNACRYPKGLRCGFCHRLNLNFDDCGFFWKHDKAYCQQCGDRLSLWPHGDR